MKLSSVPCSSQLALLIVIRVGLHLNIETIGHVSILPSSINIATYREEKLVGRPCPIIMMNTGKVVRDSESVIITL